MMEYSLRSQLCYLSCHLSYTLNTPCCLMPIAFTVICSPDFPLCRQITLTFCLMVCKVF